MERDEYLKVYFEKIAAMKRRSHLILENARVSGKLHYYFDQKRCGLNEIIKLENCRETIIKK